QRHDDVEGQVERLLRPPAFWTNARERPREELRSHRRCGLRGENRLNLARDRQRTPAARASLQVSLELALDGLAGHDRLDQHVSVVAGHRREPRKFRLITPLRAVSAASPSPGTGASSPFPTASPAPRRAPRTGRLAGSGRSRASALAA